MRIVMPCENLSVNSYLRVYPFAKFMAEERDVTVLGPIEKRGMFPPLKNDTSIKIKTKGKVIIKQL